MASEGVPRIKMKIGGLKTARGQVPRDQRNFTCILFISSALGAESTNIYWQNCAGNDGCSLLYFALSESLLFDLFLAAVDVNDEVTK